MSAAAVAVRRWGSWARRFISGSRGTLTKKAVFTDRVHRSWYRGEHTNFYPYNREQLLDLNQCVLRGWVPDRPFITKEQKIIAFGSCFAQHVSDWLGKRGFTVNAGVKELKEAVPFVIRFGEGLNTSFAVAEQFRWAYGETDGGSSLWYDKDGNLHEATDRMRVLTRELFDVTDVFVLTLGLSEVWYDRQTGEVGWRAIPADQFDDCKYGFRVTTVEENRRNIEDIIRILETYRRDYRLIVTLSPVPLVATFRDASCMTASAVSKAILRVALDETLRSHKLLGSKVFYFPSYEIVREWWPLAKGNPFGPDNRHVSRQAVEFIMSTFARYYVNERSAHKPSA